MSDIENEDAQTAIFDGWRSVSAGVYLAIIGYGVLVGIPVISSAWVSLLGFSESEVGRVAGADLGGLSMGSIIAALLAARMNRQLLVLIAIVITSARITCAFILVTMKPCSFCGSLQVLAAAFTLGLP